jgi:hypothetical protein
LPRAIDSCPDSHSQPYFRSLLETVQTTVELVRVVGTRPMAVVLNGVPPRGGKREQAADAISSLSLTVCPAAFGYRGAFNDAGALGLTAAEYDPGGKAALEIEQVYEFVSKLLKRLPRQQENQLGEKAAARPEGSDAQGRRPGRHRTGG